MSVQSIASPPANLKFELADEFENWFRLLLEQLQLNGQRRLLSCEGSEQWCDELYERLKPQCDDRVLLSDQPIREDALTFNKSETLLGREFSVVVIDLFGGLNPDVLCIAAGLVKCGGLLILMSPGGGQWSGVTDQYGIWQNESTSTEYAFIEYFFERICFCTEACIQIRQGAGLPEIPSLVKAHPSKFIEGKTSDQLAALDGLESWLAQSRQGISLMTANRGRGKSTCLGFLVEKMVEDYGLSVCVTAHSRQSTAMLLAQYNTAPFISPDQIINDLITGDVLVIDEAAMLPSAMLDRLCRQFKRVVMATTTGGYEGTGQGFLLRFIAGLQEAQVSFFRLHQPVRWAENDYLEDWIDDTLLLRPMPSEIDMFELDLSRCRFTVCNRLSGSDKLKQIYRLMVSAHYRTRPSDFRALMENPDLVPITAEYNKEVHGVALLNNEGGFDQALCRQVFLGRRRVKGHLLAQMLTAQAGLQDFASHKGLRIQRIAVSDTQRRQGIGRSLIQNTETYALQNNYDYVGASFAFDAESAGFWQSCGFRLVHIGYGQGKSSGNHSVAVIKVLNPLLEKNIEQLEEKLRSSLSLWLCQFIDRMNTAEVITLLRYSGYRTEITEVEHDEIEAFTRGYKGFELCFVTLQRVVMQAIAQSSSDLIIDNWLVEKVIQNRGWNQLTPINDCIGRKSIQNRLRRLIAELIA